MEDVVKGHIIWAMKKNPPCRRRSCLACLPWLLR
jgi:hypothetical protein